MLDLKVEFRWFVRYYNAMLIRIQKVDRRTDLYIDSYDPNDPFIKLLLLKSLINLTFHQSDFPEKYPLSWYRELFDDMNEEKWSDREDIRLSDGESKVNYDRLPLHQLKDHREFCQLADIWEITLEDLAKLTNLCEILQRPCDNQSCGSKINKSFFSFTSDKSKITSIAIYTNNLTQNIDKIHSIINSFSHLKICIPSPSEHHMSFFKISVRLRQD